MAIVANKNTAKGDRYTYAWDLVKKATEHGCYLERIAIFESIISDRLLSYVNGKGKHAKAKTPLGLLITMAKEYVGGKVEVSCKRQLSWADGPQELSSSDLLDQIDKWRVDRNIALHGITKSLPGKRMLSPEKFKTDAREAAEQGEELTRLLLHWHETQLRKHQAENVG